MVVFFLFLNLIYDVSLAFLLSNFIYVLANVTMKICIYIVQTGESQTINQPIKVKCSRQKYYKSGRMYELLTTHINLYGALRPEFLNIYLTSGVPLDTPSKSMHISQPSHPSTLLKVFIFSHFLHFSSGLNNLRQSVLLLRVRAVSLRVRKYFCMKLKHFWNSSLRVHNSLSKSLCLCYNEVKCSAECFTSDI